MKWIIDSMRFALELKDRHGKVPGLIVTINKTYADPEEPFVVLDVTLVNKSTSEFSVDSLKLDGVEMVLSPDIEVRSSGMQVIPRRSKQDRLKRLRILPPGSMPTLPPIPNTPYLKSKQSIRGIAIWDIDKSSLNESTVLSTTILSDGKQISASINEKEILD